MGSDAFLAWSEHWPEVVKVEKFTDNYINKTMERRERLTRIFVHGMERIAERNGVERPYFKKMFPLKCTNWICTTANKAYCTSIQTVDWSESVCASDACPGIGFMAQRILYVQKKYTRKYFASCEGSNRISDRWVDTDLLWLGKGKDFGYILRGYSFDAEEKYIDLFDVISSGDTCYYQQNWKDVRRIAAEFISEYENPDAVPGRLRHILEVADTVLATGQPENFRIAHSF